MFTFHIRVCMVVSSLDFGTSVLGAVTMVSRRDLIPQSISHWWFWCHLSCVLFLHITCIRNSSCLGCVNQWFRKNSTLHSSLQLGNLGSSVRNYDLPPPPKSLKTGSSEHSSNGQHEQIVFDPHSKLGECGDLSPEWSFQGSTFQLHAANYEPRPLHSTWTLGVSLVLHRCALSASPVAPPQLC